ncbi:MAG: efflux RND transporter periplasmic adaptor subunit [Rhodobacteraceae bacterium]|nr:efflux RND transporter periplasmic adaptor subunit [Paracoccaceae bacterium]
MKRFLSLSIQAALIVAVCFAAFQVLTGGGKGGPEGPAAAGDQGGEGRPVGMGPEAQTEPVSTLVAMVTLQPTSVTPNIVALGQVTAWQESMISSETSGRVIWVNPQFEDGISMQEGTALVRLNTLSFRRDELVAQSSLNKAQEAFLDAQADTEQARIEFESLNIGEPTRQALKLAELEAAELSVKMAELELEITQDALEDTEIRMPYDGTITNRDVSIGDQINAGMSMGEITGTTRFKLVLSVLDSQIGFISPGQNVALTPTNGSEMRHGKVVSIDLKLDPYTLLNSVIVEVRDPLSGTPLRIGSYLRGAIAAPEITDVLAIPLTAITNEGYFFEISDEMILLRHLLVPVFRDQTNAYVASDTALTIVEQGVLGLREGQIVVEQTHE